MKSSHGDSSTHTKPQFLSAEKQSQKDAVKYQALFFASRDAIMTLEPPSWKFTSGNPATLAMFGAKTEEEFLSYEPWKLSPSHQPDGKKSSDKAKEMIDSAMREGSIFFEWIHRRITGEDFRATVLLSRVEINNYSYLQALVRDVTKQKAMEEKLKQYEKENFKIIFDNASEGMIVVDAKTKKIVMANDAMCHMLGYTVEMLRHLSMSDIHPKEEYSSVIEQFDKLMKKEIPQAKDVPVKRKDGSIFIADIHASTITIDGNLSQLGIFQDVTKSKKLVESLRLSEEKYRTLINHLNDGIFIIQDEKLQFINESFAKIVGYTAREAIGMKFQDFIAPAYQKIVAERYAQRQKGKANLPTDYEIQILKKDKTPIDVLMSVGIITFHGKVASMGVMKDITARKKAEYEATVSELRYRRLFETARDGVLLVDFESGKIVDVNPYLIEMLGYSKENFLDKHLWDIGVLKDVVASKDNFFTLQKKRYVRFEDLPLQTKDGKKMEVEFVANAYQVDGSTIIQCNIRDITERKQAERNLKLLSIRQSAILEAIPDILMEVDTHKVYVWANQPGIEFFGDDVLGKNADSYFEGSQNIFKQVKSIFEGREDTVYVESWQRRKDGQKRLLAWWCQTLKNEQGIVIGALSSARDITDERTLQQRLLNSEHFLRTVVDLVPHFIFAKDMESRFILVNKAVADAYGSNTTDIVGKSDKDFSATPEQAAHFHADDLAVIHAGKQKFIPEELIKDAKGNIRYLQTTKIPFFIDNGASKGLLGVSVDITEQKKLRDKIIEDKSKDEAILDSIGDAVFACDVHGIIILFNKMAEQLTGFSATEAIGLPYTQVLTFVKESDGMPSNDFVKNAIANNEITKMTNHTILIHRDGTQIPVADSAAPIQNVHGEVIGCVAVFHDVSHEREVDRAKTEFVSLASHQLRTPLTTINWYTETLLSSDFGKLNPKQMNYLVETHNASKRMVSLIDALLNVSRLEVGTFSIDTETVEIQALVKVCLQDLFPTLKAKKIIFQETYDPNAKTMEADKKLLGIIFTNLLSNAIKYTPAGGKVSFDFKKQKNAFLITVTDTGVGIPKTQQGKIFGKLFRADNAIKIDPDGTGLGLYIVQSIVNYSGGKVWFESHEGGTVFYVQFPVSGMHKKEGTKQLV